MATTMTARRRVFAAGITAALAFGGAQALAAPAPAAEQQGVCNQEACHRLCLLISPFGGGCTPDGSCVCFI
jgi:hypothetical protein